MADGTVIAICVSPIAGGMMQRLHEVEVIAGQGLKGDRYCMGEGSFNKGDAGKRQVTIMNSLFFEGSGFTYEESRRNLFIAGTEIMWLIGREFQIGEAVFKGVKYCDPCRRPSKLSGNPLSFQDVFCDRGGIIAEVLKGGIIRDGSPLIPPPKGY